jgi:prophage regulatory protein
MKKAQYPNGSREITSRKMQYAQPYQTYKIFRIREVCEITGLGRSTIYGLVKLGKFPKQLQLSARAVGWSSTSVFEWLAERVIAL